MSFGIYMTGRFGQTQEMYIQWNEFRRGREISNTKALEEQDRAIQQGIVEQQSNGCSFIIDPMFRYFSIFDAFIEATPGVSAPSQENWFNNNVFYFMPTIQGPLQHHSFTERFLYMEHLPEDKLAVLPSPYTLLRLSHVEGYGSEEEAIDNFGLILRQEAEYLAKKGFKRIHFDEPTLIHQYRNTNQTRSSDLELLARGMEICGSIEDTTTVLHTYFADASTFLEYFSQLPVDGVGIDLILTDYNTVAQADFSGKELVLGIVDARNTSIEDSVQLADIVRRVTDGAHPDRVFLTPTTGTHYIGWTKGLEKLRVLSKTLEELHE